MAFNNLSDFIQKLQSEQELIVIDEYVSTELEITEITDRISKAPGSQNKALLFVNNGTQYPLLINAFGSEKRICLALNCNNLDEHTQRIEAIFKQATSQKKNLSDKLSMLPLLSELNSWLPKHIKKAEFINQMFINI
mgnify:FL=1